ncbi:conserved exported hypothetical protein [Paraburkholderia ribeironis]|uniref:Lipoprotein n=1 Tax=Paraburkholderia ribeironis TaxID=1247936 RepID=A0A1N7S1C9_9BURK|nr:hypothetical protein [Paraburkholderia ribeironis]SIT41144.1 conserved exported hypothetical protein [Paraburkholderia ribeironis]
MNRGQVIGLLCGALLAGCVSAGVEVRPEQMANFRHGVTTLQDVVTVLGPASAETALDDGSTLLVYTYVTSRPHPESYLPFIGALVGGADTHSSAAVFLFDPHGILKSANTTASNVGTGVSSGSHTEQHSAPVRTSEPQVVIRSVQPPAVQSVQAPAVQSVEPIPEEDGEPATQIPVELQPDNTVQPASIE